jgi:O-acetyl-ADP-ribose deacetylase (regulator of RNase III)
MLKAEFNKSSLGVMKADITNTDHDAFVFYARSDLKLGSGFGNAIALRGGPSIRKELEHQMPLKVTEAVVTTAGAMKAKHIIHANGPKFQEENLEAKLKATIINVLKIAELNGIKSIAFPPMGTGFYGVPLDASIGITIDTIADYLGNGSDIREVVVCGNDSREYGPLEAKIKTLTEKAA